MKSRKDKPGSEYEKIVANIHRQFADGATVTENEHITGIHSGKPRQIDVAVRKTVAGHPILMIVECKDYTRRVGIGEVEELIGKIEDVGASTGVLVSNSGFSEDAINRAQKLGRIQLATVIDAQNRKVRTYLTVPFVYEYLGLIGRIEVRVIHPDGTPYHASTYEQQKFFNFFVADWNSGQAPHTPGNNVYRRMIDNRFSGQKLGIEFTYSIRQELFSKRLDIVSGTGIYDVRSKQFTTNGFALDRFPVTPEAIRATWVTISAEEISDANLRETTFFFRAVRTLEPIAEDGDRSRPVVPPSK